MKDLENKANDLDITTNIDTTPAEGIDLIQANDPEQSSDSESTSGSGKKKKKILMGLAAILLLLAIIYGGGYYYYSSHFPHAVSANGQKLSEMTVEEAEKSFTEDYASHSITITEKERKEVIDATAIGTRIDVGSQVQDLFDSYDPRLWFTNIFGEHNHTLHLDVSYDKEALMQTVNAMECFKEENIIAPVSCYIEANETEFVIVPEVLGNTVLKDELIACIDECLSTCKTTINLEESNLYLLPQYFAADQVVVDALATANKYSHGTIVHDFTYASETIDYSMSHKWVQISRDFEVSLNDSDVGDYIVSLGKKYNTMGSGRNFKTAWGGTVRTVDGDYGWRIDFQKEKKKLLKELKSGEDVNRKPVYSYTAAIQTADDDIGDSYVEVSIARQELWLFVDGDCIMNTSVVTGKPPHGTDTGVYGITYKKRDDYLEGYNSDGTPYRSHVDYWMPFNGNQGLHDASWRDSFGGNIYKSNGSHGCVNCPVWAAATLFKYVDEGFPVIIY